ncbi:MAG: DNA-binding MarR family transcriptional regulator [Planctomycetota bacterium]|jgi:DNA-binding MarR family transcriptional regulator
MSSLTKYTKLCMNYSVVGTAISKKLDSSLSLHGISFSEFMILSYLDKAPGKAMKRIDLAEQIGLSASGITRMVLPMEKIGLVKKETNQRDARVRLVKLSTAGKRILGEASSSLNVGTKRLLAPLDGEQVLAMQNALADLGGNVE